MNSLGTGPNALPPFLHPGARRFPCLAFPLPFYGKGFAPRPDTSPIDLTCFVIR